MRSPHPPVSICQGQESFKGDADKVAATHVVGGGIMRGIMNNHLRMNY